MDKRRRLRIRMFLGVAVVMTGLTLVAYAFHFAFFEGLEQQSIDMRFSLRGSERTPSNIVLVKIDDVTFSEINQRWPFNRTLQAQLIRRICSAQPKAIAIDIQFSEFATIPEDNALYLALKSCPNKVVLGTTEVKENTGIPHLIFPPDVLKAMKVKAGNAVLPTDRAQ